MARIWDHDHTVWKPEPTEITNRLGWLHLHDTMRQYGPAIESLRADILAAGFTHVLLLGMGGSSLAPEVFAKTFGGLVDGRLTLSMLDSTKPEAVLAQAEQHDLSRTLFIVATKSGGTVETMSFFKYFYNRLVDIVGADQVGQHFVAITDSGSKLDKLAGALNFRQTFRNDPNVGGRFSALSLFGLVPAGLIGIDLNRLLDRGAAMGIACQEHDAGSNPGAWLGAVMGQLALDGRDKLTLVTSPQIASFGDWAEQLIAESTGKEGKGIVPVVGEDLGMPELYGSDRLFVSIQLGDESTHESALDALAAAGFPVMRLALADPYDLGRQFLLWEFATAVAGHLMQINPFDQPDVEAAKVLAREAVAGYAETGKLPVAEAKQPSAKALKEFLAAAQPGDYVALQAYVQPADAVTAALQALRVGIRDTYHLATTAGYGPRFLHSTGQLHKGDDGSGLFVQFVSDDGRDVPIPDEAGGSTSALTFGVLITAQAAGDRGALLKNQRRFIRFDLGGDVVGGLEALSVL